MHHIITIVNKFSDENDERSWVFQTFENQEYLQIYMKITFCLYSDKERLKY